MVLVGITTKENPELFRRCSDVAVLEGFSHVFDNARRLAVWKSSAVSDAVYAGNGYGTLEIAESEHEVSDKIYYSTEGSVKAVDTFLSHVWEAPRWQKALTLLYSANIVAAVRAAVVSWVVAIAAIILFSDRDLIRLGGVELTAHVVYMPVGIFFLIFFFGHLRPGRIGRTVWVDKLCIHQTREDLKLAGVSCLPEFVANSRRMSILWNSTYFERLWCICEVATFTAAKGGADSVDFEPLWRAPWVLSTILVDLICISVSMKFMFLIPLASTFVEDLIGIEHPPLVNLLSAILGVGSAFAIGYIPALIPNYISFRFKISNHERMRRQVSHFCLADTKVTVESDREVVEGHIIRLFKSGNEEPEKASIQRFNEYMQHEFFDTMTARLGPVTYISYSQSMLAVLPLVLSSASDILGCDGGDCAESAAGTGFDDPYVYIASNTLSWTIGCLLVYPSTYPVMLRGMCRFRGSRFEKAGCALVVVAAYLYMGLVEGAVMGLVTNSMTIGSTVWILSLVALIFILSVWNVFLFHKG